LGIKNIQLLNNEPVQFAGSDFIDVSRSFVQAVFAAAIDAKLAQPCASQDSGVREQVAA